MCVLGISTNVISLLGIHTTDTYKIHNFYLYGLTKYSLTWSQLYSPRNIWWCLEIVEFVIAEVFLYLKQDLTLWPQLSWTHGNPPAQSLKFWDYNMNSYAWLMGKPRLPIIFNRWIQVKVWLSRTLRKKWAKYFLSKFPAWHS